MGEDRDLIERGLSREDLLKLAAAAGGAEDEDLLAAAE